MRQLALFSQVLNNAMSLNKLVITRKKIFVTIYFTFAMPISYAAQKSIQ